MKIATYNINGINGRLAVMLKWLAEAQPDIVCLQELKEPQDKFPTKALLDAGYNAIWHGQKMWNGVAILAKGKEIQEVRNALPGNDLDDHSRYIEAIVDQMQICCLYLPNGNPAPGPKFDYKLAWFKRLNKHAKDVLSELAPVVLAGDYNVIPTELDCYKPDPNIPMYQSQYQHWQFAFLFCLYFYSQVTVRDVAYVQTFAVSAVKVFCCYYGAVRIVERDGGKSMFITEISISRNSPISHEIRQKKAKWSGFFEDCFIVRES